ncbi:MAG: hypothetical protein AB1445_09610 [Bacillota bacterium]
MRREVPIFIATVVALYAFVWQVSHHAWNTGWLTQTDLWRTFMVQVAVFLGAINLTRLHANNIRRRREHWIFSVICIVVLWSYMALGMLGNGLFTSGGNNLPTYRWIHDAMLVPIDSAIFSLLAFFIASAAYRAFRVRTREATAMLVVAVIIMLSNVPVGEVIWSKFPTLGQWILKFPNAAGMRGIQIGVFLGTFAATLRLFLGLERKYLGA